MGTEAAKKAKKTLNRFSRPSILATLKRVPTNIKHAPEVRRVANALQMAKENFANHFETKGFDKTVDSVTLEYLDEAYDAMASAVFGKITELSE